MPVAAADGPFRALELKIELVPIDDVRPAERNARRGDVELIRTSLQAHGQYKPLLVRRETKEVLIGNHTWHAAKAEGMTKIAVSWRSIPSDDDAREILLIDNRTSDAATYDQPELAALLQDHRASAGSLEGTGYSAGDLEGLLDTIDVSEPEAPPAPKRPRTRKGDVIKLGRHRLVCGDARDLKVQERAIAGADVDLVLTDPPYGVSIAELANMRADRAWAEMPGDDQRAAELIELHRDALGNAYALAKAGAPAYVFHSDVAGEQARAAFREAGWRLAQVLAWVKNSMVLGRQDYQWRHEPILYGWKGTGDGGHRWYGQHNKTTVLEGRQLDELDRDELLAIAKAWQADEPATIVRFDRPQRSLEHPTMKPVDLVAYLLKNSSQPGDVVLDPFAGSGTTILAAEQLERTAAAVELEPAFCDVAAARYKELTGNTARWPTRRRPSKKGKKR